MRVVRFVETIYKLSNIDYSSDELIRLFSNWDTIMEMWDDNKSHSINEGVFQHIHQSCRMLIDMSETIHIEIQQIEEESDSIYSYY